MSNKKNVKYNLDSIDAEGSTINIIYGERSNGKSYQVKHKKGVIKYWQTGKRFILMRRWKEEISSEKIEQYFNDVDVFSITDGAFNCITMYKKQLWLSNYDVETGKTTRGDKIGYVVALSTEQNYAGASYMDVEDIIFEEFMSRSEYIGNNEPDKLINFYSTVDRKRKTTRLWLVGNTISRVCPYIPEWNLTKIVSKQKQGTIENVYLPTGVINDDGSEEKIKLSIEYCMPTGESSFAIGRHRDMLNKGSWQTDPQPHLPKSIKNYRSKLKIVFQYQDFIFLAEFLVDKETHEFAWFIYPYNKKIKDKTIVISDKVKISRYWQRNIYDTNFKNEKMNRLLYNTFRESNIFYATDQCGTDFKQVIDFTIKR